MSTIYGYIRYSSANQNDGISPEIQQNAIKNFIASQDCLHGLAYQEHADKALTGTTLKNRAGLARIRAIVRNGDHVIVYKLDRLGRNLADCATLLAEWRDKGVTFHSTQEGGGELVQNILLSVAQDFSKQLGARMKDSARSLINAGFASNQACYGYKLAAVGNRKKLEPVPADAAIVKRIFRMRATGESVRQIVKTLNADKAPSPRGGLWSVGCVHQMLKNERYRGVQYSGQRIFKKGEGLIGKRPRKEWTINRDAHAAIIDEKTWDAVRALDSKSQLSHPATPASRNLNLLTGFCRCTECGKGLYGDRTNGKKYYGHSGRNTGVSLPCHSRFLAPADVLRRVVLEKLTQHFSSQWVDGVVAMFREEVQRARGACSDVLPPLERELDRKEATIKTAMERALTAEEDDYETVQGIVKKLKAERDELRQKIEHARNATAGKLAVTSLDALEAKLRTRIGTIETGLRDKDVNQARTVLGGLLDHAEIDRHRNLEMYVKPDWVLADTDAVGIPTGI